MKNAFFIAILTISQLQSNTALCQLVFNYKDSLAEELKVFRIFGKASSVDLNGDNVKDYAFLLQNKKQKDDVYLFIIFSKASGYAKQNVTKIADIMDLGIGICLKGEQCGYGGYDKKKNLYNAVVVEANDFSSIYAFDSDTKAFKNIYYHHIGP